MDYEIRSLSNSFYSKYPKTQYPDILEKDERPYIVIIVPIDGFNWAIPLRTSVKHSYCYPLKTSSRSNKAALDYSKAVVIDINTDLDITCTIDNKEYIDIDSKINFIVSKFSRFLKKYVRMNLDKSYLTYDYVNLEKYSSIKYFKNELGVL